MSRNTIYTILSILKIVIIIIGIVVILMNIVSWRKIKDDKKIKKAAIVFGVIFLLTLIITIIEFVIAYN